MNACLHSLVKTLRKRYFYVIKHYKLRGQIRTNEIQDYFLKFYLLNMQLF